MDTLLFIVQLVLCGFAFGAENVQYSTSIDITAKRDEELIITGEGEYPWDYCTWRFKGSSCSRTADDNPKNCAIDSEENINWIGIPTIDKKCSLQIKKVDFFHNGTWSCELRDKVNLNELQEIKVNVQVQSKAQVQFASRPHQQMFPSNEYQIDCSSVNGLPQPSLSAWVGPTMEISDKDVPLLSISGQEENYLKISKLFSYVPNTDYTNLYVKCMTTQNDVFQPSIASHSFQVMFPPQPIPSDDLTFSYNEGEDAIVSIKFKANPIPRTEQVKWIFLGNENFELQPRETRNQYEARELQLEPPFVTATLLIKGNTKEQDMQFFHYLKAVNDQGEQEYPFMLISAPDPTPEVVETDLTNSAGFPVWAIVVIVVGIILLASAIAILLFFFRYKRICCWEEKIKTTYYSVDQQDNETSYQKRPVSAIITNFGDQPDGSSPGISEPQVTQSGNAKPSKPTLTNNKLCLESSV